MADIEGRIGLLSPAQQKRRIDHPHRKRAVKACLRELLQKLNGNAAFLRRLLSRSHAVGKSKQGVAPFRFQKCRRISCRPSFLRRGINRRRREGKGRCLPKQQAAFPPLRIHRAGALLQQNHGAAHRFSDQRQNLILAAALSAAGRQNHPHLLAPMSLFLCNDDLLRGKPLLFQRMAQLLFCTFQKNTVQLHLPRKGFHNFSHRQKLLSDQFAALPQAACP